MRNKMAEIEQALPGQHDQEDHFPRQETSRGLVIECQTADDGDAEIAEALRQAYGGMKFVISPSMWLFRGHDHAQAAESVVSIMNLLISNDSSATGRFAAIYMDSTTIDHGANPGFEEPSSMFAIVGPARGASTEEATVFSYEVAKRANEILLGIDPEFQLPLPPVK
jgi:hypothetical protein